MAAEQKVRRGRRKGVKADAARPLRIKLVKSLIGASPYQREVVAGLGLRRLNQIVERRDSREIRGMVSKVPHLVTIVASE